MGRAGAPKRPLTASAEHTLGSWATTSPFNSNLTSLSQKSILHVIKNPKQSGIYWASLLDSGLALESLRVQLTVEEKEHRNSTVSPKPNDITTNKDRGSPSFFSSHIVTVLVVSPVVLMAAVLPWLIWCLLRAKDTQQRQPEASPNPTVQETIEATNTVPAPPLVYSVLDFPKRPSAVLEINPSDTEYAAVSYLPENQQR
ncbi:uncharacterized protein LOC125895685 isoform X3 [Epinephelus fuscoguttatus]|uniref:uncharacterized protein LOC125895685 isoform X3 n=1 Tax=Epinephelus fuscoguttatus TaxID=293821 RepID=UPI0020CFE98C|nr:uncharacterized protein LOC125895685 isoform X3 [Epinephelus fuscoguttatus]